MRLVAGGELNRWWRVGLPIVTPLVRLVFRTRVDGLEHLPSSGATIVAFNHISALDGPVLAIEIGRRIKRESRFLVAAEFFRKAFFGWILRRYDQIPIRRGEGDGSALEAALTAVKEGVLLAVAPEGTVNPDPDTLMRIRSGVARVALPSGAPVVPVGIWGTHRRWPATGLSWGRPWRPRLAIVFGEPLLAAGDVDDDGDVEAFRERLRAHLVRQAERARSISGEPPSSRVLCGGTIATGGPAPRCRPSRKARSTAGCEGWRPNSRRGGMESLKSSRPASFLSESAARADRPWTIRGFPPSYRSKEAGCTPRSRETGSVREGSAPV